MLLTSASFTHVSLHPSPQIASGKGLDVPSPHFSGYETLWPLLWFLFFFLTFEGKSWEGENAIVKFMELLRLSLYIFKPRELGTWQH